MTAQNNSIKIHQLRLQLLHNDYNVLPTKDKGCYIRGWSTVDTTQEFLEQHKRRADYSSTGLRSDRLVAIDIDITDEALADQADTMVEQALGRSDFCRIGRWPKRLLLYRLAEGEQAGRSARTGKFGGHQIELLCGKGRQFIAYGTHPKTGEPYYWTDEHGPREYKLMELPAVTMNQAYKLMAQLDGWLGSLGLPLESAGGARGASGGIEYDLTDEFEFQPVGGEPIAWAELREQLTTTGVFGNIRRENGEFGDSDAVHAYLAHGSGQPTMHDFARDTTHCEAVGGAHLERALPEAPPANQPGGTFTADVLTQFIHEWVLFGDEVRRVSHPSRVYKLSSLKNRFKKHSVTVPGKKGAPVTKPLVEVWQQHPDTLTADYAELRPDQPEALFIQNGAEIVFNTYRRPVHEAAGGELATLFEFLEHLIPDDYERELVLDWTAYKVRHPGWRMHGLLMVADRVYGAGRGTWIKILERLFGVEYVNETDLDDLIGSGSQAQYNEYLSESLILSVNEALEEKSERSRWTDRHICYEQLKKVCDPVASRARVKRKFGSMSREYVFASILIASNHADALAIPPSDRRLIVIDNGAPLVDAPGKLIDRIQEWKEQPANIAAFYHYLYARADQPIAKYDPFGNPPMTNAKERMIEASQSDVDVLFEIYLEQVEGDVAVFAQWTRFANRAAREYDMSLPDGVEQRERMLRAVWKKHTIAAPALPTSGFKYDGKMVRPRLLRRFEHWRTLAEKGSVYRKKLREELNKNGTIGGDIVSIR